MTKQYSPWEHGCRRRSNNTRQRSNIGRQCRSNTTRRGIHIRPIIRWVILRGMSNDTRRDVDIGRNHTRRDIRSTRNRIDIRRRSCPSYHAKQCRYPMKKQQERVLISFEDALAPARDEAHPHEWCVCVCCAQKNPSS